MWLEREGKILEGSSFEKSLSGKTSIYWVPTKLKTTRWGPYGTILTILRERERYYYSHFADAETEDGNSCDPGHPPQKQPVQAFYRLL